MCCYLDGEHVLEMGTNENICLQCEKNALTKINFNHYTKLTNMKSIFEKGFFRLNRIDKVNDLAEKSFIKYKEIYKTVYIGCFTHNENESIPQWYMYTPKDEGVYINYELKNQTGDNLFQLIDKTRDIIVKYQDNKTQDKYNTSSIAHNLSNKKNLDCFIYLTLSDVAYLSDDEIELYKPYIYVCDKGKKERKTVATRLAKLKSKYWNFEYETRIIANYVSTKKVLYEPPEGIYVPLNFDNMKITIYLNPWATKEFMTKVKSICNSSKYIKDFEIKYSNLYNKLNKRTDI